MYCVNCGRENNDDAKFCCFCGASVNPSPENAVGNLPVSASSGDVGLPSEIAAPFPTEQIAPITVEGQGFSEPVIVPESVPAPPRTFTLKHIILCLASTAVCAVAAGAFAALYFSANF